MELRLSERGELRHHVVARLGRVGDVGREEVGSLTALADRRQVWRAEVRAAGAEICMARSAPGACEDRRAGDRLLVVGEPCRCAHVGTACTTSLASASFAVAPLYVSTPIEMTTSTAAIRATGRRSNRLS